MSFKDPQLESEGRGSVWRVSSATIHIIIDRETTVTRQQPIILHAFELTFLLLIDWSSFVIVNKAL